MQPKRVIRHGKTYIVHPDPTPEEISERCAEIRSGWSELDYAKRTVERSRHVEVSTSTFNENDL